MLKANSYKLKANFGFTLTELLIVVSIISVLSIVSLFGFNRVQQRARDARRIADIQAIRTALEMHYREHGAYPDAVATGNLNVWETSISPTFLQSIQPYFNSNVPQDRRNIENGVNHTDAFTTRPNGDYWYAYNHYANGQEWGCNFSGPFAVIAIRTMEERSNLAALPHATCGPQPCPIPIGGGPTNPAACVDWFSAFDYSVILR